MEGPDAYVHADLGGCRHIDALQTSTIGVLREGVSKGIGLSSSLVMSVLQCI